MNYFKTLSLTAAMVGMTALGLSAFSVAPATAELDTSKLPSIKPTSPDHPLDEIISGYEFRVPETKALQDDDFDNPAYLWVERGEEAWSTVDGEAGKACESCHNDAEETMAGVRAAMPKWDEATQKPITLQQQINRCRTDQMKAESWKWDSDDMLGMAAFIGTHSRGMPLSPTVDGKMEPWFKKGEEIYYTRYGQLDMACSNCHEDNYGNNIRADMLSQGQINGFPTYRLKWQKPGSIHRRFKGCMKSIRADGFKVGSDELIALELYVSWRGQGLPVETPAVRQ
ncbi:sulfur oxidation c-type cytochrome SoxA [Rhodovibrionaceae bacterium A322]